MDEIQREEIKSVIKHYEERGLDWGDVVLFLVAKYEGKLKELQFGLEKYKNFHEKFMKHQAILDQRRLFKREKVTNV
jgi:hypothetical protein